jgi:hypothetical protein
MISRIILADSLPSSPVKVRNPALGTLTILFQALTGLSVERDVGLSVEAT